MTGLKRALISVSDKTGIIEFARGLVALGVEVISTGGTYTYLCENGVLAKEVSSITNFPEILDGRVKTLHPQIHGGILALRDNPAHMAQMQEHRITGIDLVCVNLYPFEKTITNPTATLTDAIENIDIGGPAMIRASAKNHQHVVILTSPNDYSLVLNELSNTKQVHSSTRLSLAQKAFSHTAYYDSIISNYLSDAMSDSTDNIHFNDEFNVHVRLVQKLRYGENAHQDAAFYRNSGNVDGQLASFKQLQGKELSYNNLVDADTAWECVKQFTGPSCVIVKHANPCGVAQSEGALTSYQKAFAADSVSGFGGVIAFNTTVDKETAECLTTQFVEVLIAPDYTNDAREVLAKKANIRVLQIKLMKSQNKLEYKSIGGGLLVQTPEAKHLDFAKLECVTELKPHDKTQLSDLEFAWNVARFVKSNAIVLVKGMCTIGIGAGQMSRIDSTKIALAKAREFGFSTDGAVCASDAFFPFRDNVDLLADNGISAIAHPGGSIKDKEVISAANEKNIAMILTGYRAFRH